MATNRTPYAVFNKNNTEYSDEALRRCVLPALCEVTFGEMKLMQYYMDCGDGFAPAARTVFYETGVKENYLYRLRTALAEKQYLIIDDEKHTITVNWTAMIRASIAITMLRKCESESEGMNASQVFEGGTLFTEPTKLKARRVRKRNHEEVITFEDTPEGHIKFLCDITKKFSKSELTEILETISGVYEKRFGVKLTDDNIKWLVGNGGRLTLPEVTYGMPKEWAERFKTIPVDGVVEPEPDPDEIPLPF